MVLRKTRKLGETWRYRQVSFTMSLKGRLITQNVHV